MFFMHSKHLSHKWMIKGKIHHCCKFFNRFHFLSLCFFTFKNFNHFSSCVINPRKLESSRKRLKNIWIPTKFFLYIEDICIISSTNIGYIIFLVIFREPISFLCSILKRISSKYFLISSLELTNLPSGFINNFWFSLNLIFLLIFR